MKILLTDAGKRFNRDWIFRHINTAFSSGNAYAITGPNGSGKSTLLQAISGALHFNEGQVAYQLDANPIATENIFQHVSICAPYLDVIDEMTLLEFFSFHTQFKSFINQLSIPDIISMVGLEKAAQKQIRYFSSGMKQRVKLAQCILSDTAIVLLDEPCTNLDTAGINLYHRLIEDFCTSRLVIVSSNDEVEYRFCNEKLDINQYK